MFFCLVAAVKQSDFKTCSQSPFCDRQTAFAKLADLNSAPSVSLLSIDFQDGFITGRLDSSFVFNFTLFQNSVRFQLAEQDPLHARYSVADYALLNLPPKITFSKNVDSKQITVAFGNNSLIIQKSPFSFEFFSNNVPVSSFNQRGYFNYEKYREKTDDEPSAQTPVSEIDRLKDRLKANLWSEQFQSHFSDIKKGPSSIGFDIQFPGSSNVYGIPEHASGFSLKPTRGGNAIYKEPYRLYNLDVFEYELDNPMALYGSVPFLMSHKRQYSTAVLWLNAAEMWVDIEKSKEAVTSHWMAESGSLDLLYFLGPTQQEIFDAHAKITGKPQIPQEFAIAYHQCRWNYDSAQDVAQVDANFDNFDIPYDVLWLDIEHTDGKRYFTWDNAKFPKPEDMQASLASKSRKMVTIIDPHIKKDAEYSVSAKAKELDIFVKDNAGDVFSGNCWPGDSNWIDYSNPKGSQFWSERFLFGNYKGSTESLYTWNDMNEPSVFSGPEITMPKGNIHFNNVEHRDIHNLYGTLMHKATFEGHLLRKNNQDRPFVLSRAFFIGTQRYGAIWTGDNMAEWSHLAVSVPMLLTIGVAGIPFAGADVGGFFKDTEPELFARWFQLGALQPFFRGHKHIESKRHEPWLFGEPFTSVIREAIRRRYKLLPYIYTLFAEAHVSGVPVMRSMMYEFPNDEQTFAMDDQYMLGDALLVKPVTEKDQKVVKIYVGDQTVWYDYESLQKVNAKNTFDYSTSDLGSFPILLRGGKIIARKDRVRRSSAIMKRDPYTLVIALDSNQSAAGQLYVDDGKSYKHQNGEYIFTQFRYENSVLKAKTSRISDISNQYGEAAHLTNKVERIIIAGMDKSPIEILVQDKKLEFKFTKESVLMVKLPNVEIGLEWEIKFQ